MFYIEKKTYYPYTDGHIGLRPRTSLPFTDPRIHNHICAVSECSLLSGIDCLSMVGCQCSPFLWARGSPSEQFWLKNSVSLAKSFSELSCHLGLFLLSLSPSPSPFTEAKPVLQSKLSQPPPAPSP